MTNPAPLPDSANPYPALATSAPATPTISHASNRVRLIALLLLAAAVIAASVWLFGTEHGRQHLSKEYLYSLGKAAQGWTDRNPFITIGLFILAYTVCAVLLLPVWWLQMLAGFAFDLWAGLALAMAGSTCGALVTAYVSRWLGEEWVHARIVGKGKGAQRLRKIIEVADRNGLLVVFISRLSYPIPYGVSNYLFGLLEIRRRDIALGTAVGGIPVYAGWVAAGARPHWLAYWQFWAIVIGVNLALLVPLLVHSLRAGRAAARQSSPA